VKAPRSRPGRAQIRSRQRARRLALASIFEADFGHRTAAAVLDRHLAEAQGDHEAARFARLLVTVTIDNRDQIDRRIEQLAAQYPVVQLARIDRALLRTAIGEVLHSAATPARIAIAEWVELARIYSGDPARRLMNGVLGRIARDAAASAGELADGSANEEAGIPAG
jgi:transcription antitermination protein NusB